MKRLSLVLMLVVLALAVPGFAGTRGADQLFWVPTFEQALEMGKVTKRPIFMTFYTCVGEGVETYSGRQTVW